MARPTARTLLIATTALVLVTATPLLVVEATYRWVLAGLPPVPIPPEPPPPPELQLLPHWRLLGGDDPLRMEAIRPWSVHRLFAEEPSLDTSARASRCVALGLLDSEWGSDLPPVAGSRRRLTELALAMWVSRHYTARQAVGTIRTWNGWSAWPNPGAVPKTNRAHCPSDGLPPDVPGRVLFPGGSVRIPDGCTAPTRIPMMIDAFIGSIRCEHTTITVIGDLVTARCDTSPDKPRFVATFASTAGAPVTVCSSLRMDWVEDRVIQELVVDLGPAGLWMDIRKPTDVLLGLEIGSSFEPHAE